MKVLVTVPFIEKQKELLKSTAGDAELCFMPANEVTEEMLAEAEIIMGNVSSEQAKRAKNLKWLQLNSAGADVYCAPGVLKEETVLTNASGAYDISVSESMVMGTFAMLKKAYAYYDNQKQGLWKDEGMVGSAYGACIVILGLGNIGLSYAKKMKAMGSYIIGVKRHESEAPEGVDEICTIDKLEECLRRADVVAAVLPGTPETKYLMGKEQFEVMKKTAYFLNVGRGNSVDEEALYQALESGEIAGAMLDVTEVEPLPAGSKLWNAKNLFITPHVAGGFHIPVTLDKIAEICAENLKAYLAGGKLKNIVDKSLGY